MFLLKKIQKRRESMHAASIEQTALADSDSMSTAIEFQPCPDNAAEDQCSNQYGAHADPLRA